MRFSTSLFLSLFLHIAVLLLLLAGVAVTPSFQLDIPQNQVTIINLSGLEGGSEAPIIPVDSKDANRGEQPQPKEEPKTESVAQADPKPVESKPVEPDAPKVLKEPEPKEPVKPEPEAPKVEEKPKPEPKEEPKPKEETKPKEEPKEKPKEPPKEQTQQAKNTEKPKEQPKKNKPKDNTKGVGGEKGLEDVISAMQAEVSSRDKTGGGSGRGQGQGQGNAVGIQASYLETVKAIIQREWAYGGRADRALLQAVVRLEIDPNGKIVGYTFLRRSGDPTFDSTLETALSRSANKLTPPPNPSLQNLEITFYDNQ